MLNESSREIAVKNSVNLRCDDRIHAIGLCPNRGASRRHCELKGQQSALAKVSGRLGEDRRELVQDLAEAVDDLWSPAFAVEIEGYFAHVNRKAAPQRHEARPLVSVETLKEGFRRLCRWRRFLFC